MQLRFRYPGVAPFSATQRDLFFGRYGSDAVTNPLGPASDAERVIRGGSWRGDPARIRATRRSSGNPGGQSDGLGFRLAKAEE